MANLQSFSAKMCLTIAAVLIHENRVLLVKHKKLGFWLNPGGHIEGNELPHKAAEREFWEEAGIKVKAVSFGMMQESQNTEYVPSSFASNIHWVCQDNYEHRVHGKPLTEYAQKHWKKGCEQHFNMLYLVEPTDEVNFKQNVEETDGIAWYTMEELEDLDTPEQIKDEVKYAFKISSKLKRKKHHV